MHTKKAGISPDLPIFSISKRKLSTNAFAIRFRFDFSTTYLTTFNQALAIS